MRTRQGKMEEDKTTRLRQECEEKERTGRENMGDKTAKKGKEKKEERTNEKQERT